MKKAVFSSLVAVLFLSSGAGAAFSQASQAQFDELNRELAVYQKANFPYSVWFWSSVATCVVGIGTMDAAPDFADNPDPYDGASLQYDIGFTIGLGSLASMLASWLLNPWPAQITNVKVALAGSTGTADQDPYSGWKLFGTPTTDGLYTGMTLAQAKILEPRPSMVNRTVTASDEEYQLVYSSNFHKTIYLYFDNGVLTGWQD